MRCALLVLTAACLFFAPTSAVAEEFNPVLIYQGEIQDNSFNLTIHEGVKRFEQETGEECTELIVEANQQTYAANVERIAEQGYSPIFLLYGNHLPALSELARQYPATRFVVLDVVKDEPNMYSFSSSEHEGSFLAGALAAMASKSNIIGFVSVSDIPIMRRFLCGYVQGAKHINPSITVLEGFIGDYEGSWFDGAATAAKANELMDQGADVIYQAAGGAGPAVLEAAAKRDKLGIGVDRNQNGLYPGHVLTSMIKRTDMAVYAALMLAKRGIWRDNVKQLGLAQDVVGVVFDEHNAPLVTPQMRQRIESLKTDIVLGEIEVHDYTRDLKCPE
jgi:basic membrane protein A